MPLVTSVDFEKLPADPHMQFIKLRDLVESRLENLFETQQGATDRDLIEYCTILSTAAKDLGIGALAPVSSGAIRENFEDFRSQVVALSTSLSIRALKSSENESIALQRETKARILRQVSRLREIVAVSELPRSQKVNLEKKLDELCSLVSGPRTDLRTVGLVILALSALVSDVTSFAADAPSAIGTIAALIGAEHLEIEEHQKLLPQDQPPKAIPDLRGEAQDDNEIPF